MEETLEVPVLADMRGDDGVALSEDERLELLAEELRAAIRRKVAPPE